MSTSRYQNRLISALVLSAIANLTLVASASRGKEARAASTGLTDLDHAAEADCTEAVAVGSGPLRIGDDTSVETHKLYDWSKCKVVKRTRYCAREVYESTPNGSRWKCVDWREKIYFFPFYATFACERLLECR